MDGNANEGGVGNTNENAKGGDGNSNKGDDNANTDNAVANGEEVCRAETPDPRIAQQ